jgi:hypothetical protein
MGEAERLRWQETVDRAVDILEMRIGLRLVGLTRREISNLVSEWMIAKSDPPEMTRLTSPHHGGRNSIASTPS